MSQAYARSMCGRGRAVGGPRYLKSVRAACEVGPTRYAGGIACRRVTVRGRDSTVTGGVASVPTYMLPCQHRRERVT